MQQNVPIIRIYLLLIRCV